MMMLTMILCKFGKGMNGYEDMHVVFFLFLSLCNLSHSSFIIAIIKEV